METGFGVRREDGRGLGGSKVFRELHFSEGGEGTR